MNERPKKFGFYFDPSNARQRTAAAQLSAKLRELGGEILSDAGYRPGDNVVEFAESLYGADRAIIFFVDNATQEMSRMLAYAMYQSTFPEFGPVRLGRFYPVTVTDAQSLAWSPFLSSILIRMRTPEEVERTARGLLPLECR